MGSLSLTVQDETKDRLAKPVMNWDNSVLWAPGKNNMRTVFKIPDWGSTWMLWARRVQSDRLGAGITVKELLQMLIFFASRSVKSWGPFSSQLICCPPGMFRNVKRKLP